MDNDTRLTEIGAALDRLASNPVAAKGGTVTLTNPFGPGPWSLEWEPRVQRREIFGLPVVEDDTMPEGTFRLRPA